MPVIMTHSVLLECKSVHPSSLVNTNLYIYITFDFTIQALCSLWRDHYQRQGNSEQKELDDVLTSTELVLNSHGQLIEMNRVPGENEVCPKNFRLF